MKAWKITLRVPGFVLTERNLEDGAAGPDGELTEDEFRAQLAVHIERHLVTIAAGQRWVGSIQQVTE